MTFVPIILLLLKSAEAFSNDQDVEDEPSIEPAMRIRRDADSMMRNSFDIGKQESLNECDDARISIRNPNDVSDFSRNCPSPKVLKLVRDQNNRGFLPAGRMSAKQFYSFVRAPELHMCIRVEHSSFSSLNLSHVLRIRSTCEGPSLRIYDNNNLRAILLHPTFMGRADIGSVLIRGNRALSPAMIQKLNRSFPDMVCDLQEPGECGLPLHLRSTENLRGCSKIYGTIDVDRGVTSVVRSVDATGFLLTGCIDIRNTRLTNVDFLDDIAGITVLAKTCPYTIKNNPDLCIREPLRLKKKFPSIEIDQSSSPDCETVCEGGVVDDVYLDILAGCKVIKGDLVLESIFKRPSRLDNLDGVEIINGSLRISATKGLGDFSMEKLREITMEEEGPAIQISGNSGLRSLSFPALQRIESPDDIKVTIVNNPRLGMKRSEVEAMYKIAEGKRHTNIEFYDTSSLYDMVIEYKMLIIMAILIVLIILLLALITAFLMATYIKRRREFTKEGFPTPPYRLDKDSKKILTGWVNEITSKNPLIWRCSDREVIWSYQKSDGTHKDIEVLVTNNSLFLNEHMLPLAANASIQEDDHFLLCERVKSILGKEVIIMIGSERNPSCVLPRLPTEVKKQQVYKYLGSTYTFTLTRTRKMAPCTTEYTYDFVTTHKDKPPQKGSRKIYYHRWESRKLPVEFDEILQLAMLYKPGKTICVSERRKEVFSLIHMLVTYCHFLKEPIDFKDALQLHTEKCNGCVLDRSELVYVMAVIMEWAYQSRSVTPQQKQKHVEWCHSYAIMARFMRKCPNIKLVHPDYLTKLDPKVKQSVLHDGFTSSPRFSPRDSAAVKDPFRRLSTDGAKSDWKPIKPKEEAKGKAEKEETPAKAEGQKPQAEDDQEFWTKQASEQPLPPTKTTKDRIAI